MLKLVEDASTYIACLWSSRTLFNHVIVENYSTKLKLTVSGMTENCGWTLFSTHVQPRFNFQLCLTFLFLSFLNWIEDVKLNAISRANLIIIHGSPLILYQCSRSPRTCACCQRKERECVNLWTKAKTLPLLKVLCNLSKPSWLLFRAIFNAGKMKQNNTNKKVINSACWRANSHCKELT